MITGDENIPFDLDDLLSDIIAEQLAHKAEIRGLTAIIKLLAKKVMQDDLEAYKALCDAYTVIVKKEVENLMNDNIVIQRIAEIKTKLELSDIPGIVWNK